MAPSIEHAVARLETQLPLRSRQRALDPARRRLHRRVLESLVMHASPPGRDEIAALVGASDTDEAVAALAAADLVVLSKDRRRIVGAYPLTTERTPHRLLVHGRSIHAMCALDAVAVAPAFGVKVEICSRCRVTGEPVHVVQDGARIVQAQPAGVTVGVRWQKPDGEHAAHSMCREMIFLADDAAAAAWHGGDLDRYSVYALEQAVAFGAAVFGPLRLETRDS